MSSKAKKLSVRVMAWILAILMILSLAVTAIVVIVDQVRANNEAVEHDHNGDGCQYFTHFLFPPFHI